LTQSEDKRAAAAAVSENVETLRNKIGGAAFAFRGYNVTNLGRTDELLAHPLYGPIVKQELDQASQSASRKLGRSVDLLARVRSREETTLETYSDAIALIMGVEQAQIRILREIFDIDFSAAKVAFGYSLGEVAAVVAGGGLSMDASLDVLLEVADDCTSLAPEVTMGVFFSRGEALDVDLMRRLCIEITSQGHGVIAISAYLSPNSVLLLGQGDTVDLFAEHVKKDFEPKTYLRKNEHHWPPLHTPIVWQKNVPDRCGVLMHTLPCATTAPCPPVLSMVTGKASYNDYNMREILHHWIDHPQRLWDVIYETLNLGVETIVHVGPEPNLLPATYRRLSDNVKNQVAGNVGLRAVQGMANRPWLKTLLPSRAALLRAPNIEHIVLEDWLLEQRVA
jgi:[acyl-carrier-protein] S-malonyltransferase